MTWHWESDLGIGRLRLEDSNGETVLRTTRYPESAIWIRSDWDSLAITLLPRMAEALQEVAAGENPPEKVLRVVRMLNCGRRDQHDY